MYTNHSYIIILYICGYSYTYLYLALNLYTCTCNNSGSKAILAKTLVECNTNQAYGMTHSLKHQNLTVPDPSHIYDSPTNMKADGGFTLSENPAYEVPKVLQYQSLPPQDIKQCDLGADQSGSFKINKN